MGKGSVLIMMQFANEGEVFQGVDLSPEEYASFMGRQKTLKEMPTSIRRKRTIKNKLEKDARNKKKKTKHISAWKHFKLTTAMGWQHFKASCSELLYVLDLWRGHLKVIQGMFGTGVLSYFILLRWLFLINLVAFFSTVFFLFIPQMAYDASFKSNNISFGGWELLTGDGYFTSTELHYGGYTNKSIPMGNGVVYKMPLAYLCVGGGYLLLCLAILVYSMAESYRENYIYTGDDFSFYTSKLFCAWDYGITDQESATLKQKSVFNDFKEVIAEQLFQEKLTTQELCYLVFIRTLTNLLVLGMIGGGSFLIYFTATLSIEVGALEFKKLLFPVIVSVLNLVLPMTFRIISSLEQYQHPKTSIQVNLARTGIAIVFVFVGQDRYCYLLYLQDRTVLLKLTTLGVILISLFTDVTKCRKGKTTMSGRLCLPAMKTCWETYIGITFYRLILVDFIFLLLSTFFGEFVRSAIAKYIGWCGQNVGYPGFDISRNVLDLVFAQTLAWIGTFFSPLLSAVNVIKLFLLFYVKRVSVVQNCKASGRPFRAAKMNLLFLLLLAVSFMVSMITVGYTVMSDSDELGQKRMYEVVSQEVEGFPSQLRIAFQYLSSASFLAMIFCILGIIVYYYKMLKDSNEKKIKLLKDQIALAGQDKLFLMKKITSGTGFRTAVDDGQ
ncbi:hypothetical protein QZH41_020469 [Actinostola sp. cb2023]|nr:hypothetical protein QZH41_020469 [Actinostola sp. cb2023]